jgi:hypothetical protein
MTGLQRTQRRSTRRMSLSLRIGIIVSFAFVSALSPLSAMAEDEEETDTGGSFYKPPDWVNELGVSGRYVGTPNGSESKYLEDHNIRSGPIFKLGINNDLDNGDNLFIEGMIEPLQNQGYLLFDFSQAEGVTFSSSIQAWREYYNPRTGNPDETVLGTPIDASGIYPNTTDTRNFFSGGKPHTDWLRTRTGVAAKLPGAVSGVWADFIYREEDGEMSLLKGSTVFDPTVVPPTVGGSGPGTVFFDVSGRQHVDYKSVGAVAGARSSLGNVNWQLDVGGMHHDLKSEVYEANFTTDAASSELEIYEEDTTLNVVGADFVGSRSIRHNLFVFGGTSFSWDRSDPDPSQSVQTGIRSADPTRVRTRQTTGADVTRFSEAVTGGAVFMPVPDVKIRADASVRASQQDGRLNEFRDESGFLVGDVGTINNNSDRDTVSAKVGVKGDWRAARRLSLYGVAQYEYRYDDAKSKRILNFVVAEPSEREDYTTDRSELEAGVGARYRLRRGRSVEAGYQFSFVDFNNDTNELENQFIVSDYDRYRHRLYMKASGRITKKLRGELSAQYIFENRTLDAPEVQPPDIATSGNGKIEFQGFSIVPVLTYQHNQQWSGVLSVSVGRQEYKLKDKGPSPSGFTTRFSSFSYEALTETVTVGVNWVPSDTVSNALSYTVYHNSESVENVGHDASVRSTVALNENWDVDGSLRYLSFLPDGNNVDDYHTVIASLGFTGRF